MRTSIVNMPMQPADRRLFQKIRGRIVPYVLAVALVALATLLTRRTQPVLGEISPLYFAAVVLSTWRGGLGPALLATALAGWASAYFFYDIPAGTGAFGWDDALRLGVFLMVALLMSSIMHLRQLAEDSLKKANDDLENRVLERTRELESSMRIITRDITELKRLEREVLEISENEQQRIGQDLHDGLGQELTGLALLSQNLGRRLSGLAQPESAEAAQRISTLANRAIEQTRELARGLSPVELGSDGLLAALRRLGDQVEKTCGIPLEMNLGGGVRVDDHAAAVHLYRISQEAITNAARHSGASRIWLGLADVERDVIISIEDDGAGISVDPGESKGLGLRLMLYRARMIGAALNVQRRPSGGTMVRCIYRNTAESKVTGNGASNQNERTPLERLAIPSLQNSSRG